MTTITHRVCELDVAKAFGQTLEVLHKPHFRDLSTLEHKETLFTPEKVS